MRRNRRGRRGRFWSGSSSWARWRVLSNAKRYLGQFGRAGGTLRVSENTVYLLGAGFSKAVSPEMPLMGELSDAIVKQLRTIGRTDTDIPGISSPLASNFEQWLSFLVESPPWLSEVGRARNRAAFFEISQLLHSTLSERQSRAVECGTCPEWLRRLVQYWDIKPAKVITFNYDLLVELAWRVYGAGSNYDYYPPPYPPAVAPIESRIGRPAPSLYVNGLRLLKLHGSLNWRYSGPDSPPGDIVYDLGLNGRLYGVANLGWNTECLRPRSYDEAEELAADRDAMIVPPAAVKSPYYNNRTLQALWALAAEALRQADELVIMGFSLPQSDLLVSSLLMTNLRKDIVITPVDYSDAIVSRIRDTFNTGGNGARVNPIFAGLCGQALPSWVEASTPDQLTDVYGHRWEWRSSETKYVMLYEG